MKKIISVVLSAAFLFISVSFAKEASKSNQFKEALISVPAAELPAKTASLVLQAKKGDRVVTTADAVTAAVGINPAAAPAIVGAVARALPDMASVAAGAAATEQPKQAAAIAKAAAAAAPSKIRQIVIAVCRAVPNEFRMIAVAVSEAAPDSNKDILRAIATAIPDLKPFIEQTLAAYGGNVFSVADALNKAVRLAQARTSSDTALTKNSGSAPAGLSPNSVIPLARGPTPGNPYVDLTTTPTVTTPADSVVVPPGGRDYAAP